MPTEMSTGTQTDLSNSSQSVHETDILTHHENTTHRYALSKDKIHKVYNVKNHNWKELHDSMMIDKNREIII